MTFNIIAESAFIISYYVLSATIVRVRIIKNSYFFNARTRYALVINHGTKGCSNIRELNPMTVVRCSLHCTLVKETFEEDWQCGKDILQRTRTHNNWRLMWARRHFWWLEQINCKMWRCTYLGRDNNGSLEKPLINRISKIHSGLSTSCSWQFMVHFTINPICITGARQRAFSICVPWIASAEIGTKKITMVYMRTHWL